MKMSKPACAVAAICCYAAVAFIYVPVISSQPFAYDDADYMWAGRQGLWANFTSEHSISFVEFVRKGLELAHDPARRQEYSDFIRSSGDIEFYRHYHGPMYAYWLALLSDAGVRSEAVFRGSGLLIHFASATLILLGMWMLFPSLPPVAGLVACILFVFNRSALTAGLLITQHLVFAFLCIATLLTCSLFMRTLASKWFYAAMALLACAFCTVETSVLLVGALGLSMIVEYRRIREKWPSLKALGGLLARGAGVFVLTILILWPMGILQLGIAKGFLQQAYIAVYRKTFSPLGPLDLWKAEFRVAPGEFPLLMAGAILAVILWRRFAQRRELLPWLAFIAGFFLITLKVTAPYSYYYAPLTAASAVATGVAFGILWGRWGWLGRAGMAVVVAAAVTVMTVQFRQAMRETEEAKSGEQIVLRLVAEHPPAGGARLYLPYQLVPSMHYYHPEIATVGYDFDFPMARLADGIESKDAADIMFCEAPVCEALEKRIPQLAARKSLLAAPGPNGGPFYLIRLRGSANE